MLESQYPALKQDIDTDPRGRGFAGKSDQQIADLYNLVRAGLLNRADVGGGEIVAAVVKSEYTALTAQNKAYLDFVVQAGSPIPFSATLVSEMGTIFGAGTTSRANLIALRTRAGSDAELLSFGRVEVWDVSRARALP